MNQIHGVVPGKDDEADCDSDKVNAISCLCSYYFMMTQRMAVKETR